MPARLRQLVWLEMQVSDHKCRQAQCSYGRAYLSQLVHVACMHTSTIEVDADYCKCNPTRKLNAHELKVEEVHRACPETTGVPDSYRLVLISSPLRVKPHYLVDPGAEHDASALVRSRRFPGWRHDCDIS